MMIPLGALALSAALSTTRTSHAPLHDRAADTLRVVLLVDDTIVRRSLLDGARLGAEEASHTGALFGTVVTLRVETAVAEAGMGRASGAAESRLPHSSLLIVAGDARTCSPLLFQSTPDSTPVLDAGCASRDTARASNVYTIAPASPAAAAGDTARLELWHWSLERFGGEQLNQRFVRRFGRRMDSPAWAGWMAMKIALDAALHAKGTGGATLLRQLADPRAQYDGQKGRPLRFAPGTRELVQPLYRVAGHGDAEHVVAEVAP